MIIFRIQFEEKFDYLCIELIWSLFSIKNFIFCIERLKKKSFQYKSPFIQISLLNYETFIRINICFQHKNNQYWYINIYPLFPLFIKLKKNHRNPTKNRSDQTTYHHSNLPNSSYETPLHSNQYFPNNFHTIQTNINLNSHQTNTQKNQNTHQNDAPNPPKQRTHTNYPESSEWIRSRNSSCVTHKYAIVQECPI